VYSKLVYSKLKPDWHMQDKTYATMFNTLLSVLNPTITGLALRLIFHDAGSYNPNNTASTGG
jgi:hypothetical protein